MRINFVLPRTNNTPMGGYKVVYKYANILAEEYGHEVHLYFVLNARWSKLRSLIKYISGLTKSRSIYRKVDWLRLSPKLKLHFDVFPSEICHIDEGAVVATHWSTAPLVSNTRVGADRKFYFIQDYEIFDPAATKEMVDATWKLPLKKIVVSNWLEAIGKKIGVDRIQMVPNFIDLSEFPIAEGRESLPRDTVSFLWHNNARKQSELGLHIFERLHAIYPELKYVMFGASLPDRYPEYVRFYQNATPTQLSRDIYGRSLVYFMPSRQEGWGLTGMEAMASGAAVATIDNGGIHEYAVNGISAVIVENDEDQLFDAVVELLKNTKLRTKLQRGGYAVAKQYDIAIQSAKLNQLLTNKDKWNEK